MKLKITALAIALSLGLSACSNETATTKTGTQSASATVQSESEKANKMFDDMFMEGVMRSPIYQTYMAIKKDYGKWDDISEARGLEDHEFAKANLVKLQTLDSAKLDSQTALSYKLLEQQLEDEIADYKWRNHNYPVNQMFGLHSMVPSLLINQHSISSESDAVAYISRLNGVEALLAELEKGLNKRAELGILAPKFVYPYVISDSENLLNGAPFTNGDDSTLLEDFKRKVTALEIDKSIKAQLLADAKKALIKSVKPGYESLVMTLKKLEAKADDRDGAWKFPEGEAFYNNALKNTTTTNMTADEIHNVGLSEVARIHDEMRTIMKKVKFEGDLQEFFQFMRTDKRFYYPETAKGKERYLSEAVALIENMKSRLDELFIVKPKADLIVKAVESFREKSAGKAFYQQPAPDGSRPGTYYANLYRMSDMPTYQMEALAYHEGIPGHHMQIAIAQELEGIPKFRKFGGYTAYVEGWGLYSEMIPKEIGLYEDPYSDFGRLSMELWRACRLVVDTGIHAKKWTRQEGIDYYVTNTPNPKPDAVKMVERHVVMPSQATAYKIGMLKIVQLREAAKAKLGDKFSLPEFHDVVLKDGAVPLSTLEDLVNEWVASKA
ncbi:hypothetical protein GCM10008107_14470 [Psychrosphaera saromensis]|uniref:DUF885 domain-containing protein n=1 Tax=Psychrosphaera saromensis TaxID=716813 RepID=A0A2S7UTM2_9GAMM|nr:DUF885 domain-containing protein [Psychrosphaera saromensis]PQJ53324.1 hypothetical protein BTO11_06345 [Psychrosphaera saromensis]GHB66384.1 hypothetical protein GCM10008107_14470 [Psychrosphaera saromensis]GLQ14903.1 hypothetical protein GCM10007917_23580 [Psychrosphaera saromensis]